MNKINSKRWYFASACLVALSALVTPGLVHADSGKTTDRMLAKAVAAQLAVVVEEGRRFAAARDALAKSRLHGMQSLENSLIEGKAANELQVRAWDAIGAKDSKRLYEGVLAATQDAVLQEKSRAERRQQQQRAIANQKAAINLRSADLMATAASLAALGEPPSRKAAAVLFEDLSKQLRPDIRDGIAVSLIGAALNERSISDLLLQELSERKDAARRKESK